jgi:hypothetical protein
MLNAAKMLLLAAASARYTRQIVPVGVSSGVAGTAGATSIAVTWPTAAGAVGANVMTVMVVALKPGTAGLGSVATPAGWTLIGTHIGGGYGATLGVGTGNVRVYVFSKADNTTAGSVSVTLTPDGANGVASGMMTRLEKLSGSWQSVVTTTAEATVDTNVGSYTPLAGSLIYAPGDCFLYCFGHPETFGTSLSPGPASDFSLWSPTLSVGSSSAAGYRVGATIGGRRTMRGNTLLSPFLTGAVGSIMRGPMLVARFRVR